MHSLTSFSKQKQRKIPTAIGHIVAVLYDSEVNPVKITLCYGLVDFDTFSKF